MSVEFNFDNSVVLVTGVGGALGSAVAERFLDAGATVCGSDIVASDSEEFLLDSPGRLDFYRESRQSASGSYGNLRFL